MARSSVRLLLAMALGVAPRVARADAEVTVTREHAAECPDAADLRRLATESRVPSAMPPTHTYRVSFDRADDVYRAEVADETSKRTRGLEDKGPGCAALGQAVAVVLATMWGSERDEAVASLAAAPPRPAAVGGPPAVPVDRAPRLPSSRSPRWGWIFGAGSGLAAAIVRPAAPIFLADAALDRSPVSLAIGAFWIPRQSLGLSPGAVEVELAAGTVRGCAFAWTETRLGVCGRVLVGALRAGASGFDSNTQKTRPWFAAGLEAFVDGPLPVAMLRYRGAAGAIVPLHVEAFSIAGVGSAYDAPALGGLVTLSVEIATRCAEGSGPFADEHRRTR
jgi:hypothetical protein